MKVNMEKIMRHPNAEWIIAFAEGKQLQFFNNFSAEDSKWIDFLGKDDSQPEIGPWNSGKHIQWRIKPEQQWVRVAKFKFEGKEWTDAYFNVEQEKDVESIPSFSHWLSDRLYYTPKDKA